MPHVYKLEGTCVPVEFVVTGSLDTNMYLISDGAACAGGNGGEGGASASTMVVDPPGDLSDFAEALRRRSLDAVVLTHRHFDHVGAAKALREASGAPVIASSIDAPVICGDEEIPENDRTFEPCPVDQAVGHGDILTIGSLPWKVIHTPGHTPGSICLYLDPRFGSNPQGAPVLVAGDTLFAGAIGRTDFTGGSMDDMRRSLKRLAVLPDETVVLPGHGPQTTIGAERQRVFARYA